MQESIERDLQAIGAFQSFLRIIAWKADMARQALDDMEMAKNQPLNDDMGE